MKDYILSVFTIITMYACGIYWLWAFAEGGR